MKKIIIYIQAILFITVMSSCTDDFQDINTDPNGISQSSLEQKFNNIGVNYPPMFTNIIKTQPAWNYQLQQNLNADVFSCRRR
jgi:hypothetical protein